MGWIDPLTTDKVRLFSASLVCYHHEEARRRAGQAEEARKYVNADITAWDSSTDMLLLTVGVESLKNFHDDDGVCTRPSRWLGAYQDTRAGA